MITARPKRQSHRLQARLFSEHLAFCAGFANINAFNNYLICRNGRGLGSDGNIALDPRLFEHPPAKQVKDEETEDLEYDQADMDILNGRVGENIPEYRRAPDLEDSGYGGSELMGGPANGRGFKHGLLENYPEFEYEVGMSDSSDSGDRDGKRHG